MVQKRPYYQTQQCASSTSSSPQTLPSYAEIYQRALTNSPPLSLSEWKQTFPQISHLIDQDLLCVFAKQEKTSFLDVILENFPFAFPTRDNPLPLKQFVYCVILDCSPQTQNWFKLHLEYFKYKSVCFHKALTQIVTIHNKEQFDSILQYAKDSSCFCAHYFTVTNFSFSLSLDDLIIVWNKLSLSLKSPTLKIDIAENMILSFKRLCFPVKFDYVETFTEYATLASNFYYELHSNITLNPSKDEVFTSHFMKLPLFNQLFEFATRPKNENFFQALCEFFNCEEKLTLELFKIIAQSVIKNDNLDLFLKWVVPKCENKYPPFQFSLHSLNENNSERFSSWLLNSKNTQMFSKLFSYGSDQFTFLQSPIIRSFLTKCSRKNQARYVCYILQWGTRCINTLTEFILLGHMGNETETDLEFFDAIYEFVSKCDSTFKPLVKTAYRVEPTLLPYLLNKQVNGIHVFQPNSFLWEFGNIGFVELNKYVPFSLELKDLWRYCSSVSDAEFLFEQKYPFQPFEYVYIAEQFVQHFIDEKRLDLLMKYKPLFAKFTKKSDFSFETKFLLGGITFMEKNFLESLSIPTPQKKRTIAPFRKNSKVPRIQYY